MLSLKSILVHYGYPYILLKRLWFIYHNMIYEKMILFISQSYVNISGIYLYYKLMDIQTVSCSTFDEYLSIVHIQYTQTIISVLYTHKQTRYRTHNPGMNICTTYCTHKIGIRDREVGRETWYRTHRNSSVPHTQTRYRHHTQDLGVIHTNSILSHTYKLDTDITVSVV